MSHAVTPQHKSPCELLFYYCYFSITAQWALGLWYIIQQIWPAWKSDQKKTSPVSWVQNSASKVYKRTSRQTRCIMKTDHCDKNRQNRMTWIRWAQICLENQGHWTQEKKSYPNVRHEFGLIVFWGCLAGRGMGTFLSTKPLAQAIREDSGEKRKIKDRKKTFALLQGSLNCSLFKKNILIQPPPKPSDLIMQLKKGKIRNFKRDIIRC